MAAPRAQLGWDMYTQAAIQMAHGASRLKVGKSLLCYASLYLPCGKFTWGMGGPRQRVSGVRGMGGREGTPGHKQQEGSGRDREELGVSRGQGSQGPPGPECAWPAASKGPFICSPPC